MAGRSNQAATDFGVTRTRKTHVFFDPIQRVLNEQPFVLERAAPDMGRTHPENLKGHQFVMYEGAWCVANYWEDMSLAYERTEAASAYLDSGDGSLGTYTEEVSEWRKPNTAIQDGVLDGASANLATTAPLRMRAQVAAGADWALKGLSDAATYPTVYQQEMVTDNSIAMDLVYVTNTNDNKYRDIHFEFWIPGNLGDHTQLIYQLQFVGPASCANDLNAPGLGQYCINVYGSGYASLFEKLVDNTTWVHRLSFRYSPQMYATNNKLYYINIYKIIYEQPKIYGAAGKLVFVTACTQGQSITNSAVDWTYSRQADLQRPDQHFPSYTARMTGNATTPTQEAAIRVRERRDLTGSFGVAIAKRPAGPTIFKDDVFTIPFYPVDDTVHFNLFNHSQEPSGTDVELKLYSADDDTELTLVSTAGNLKVYQIKPNCNAYYVTATFTTNGVNTSLFTSWKLQRDAIYKTVGESAEFETLRGISLVGAERDPKHESGTVLISDLNETADMLRTRGSIPFDIAVEWQPDVDTSDLCYLGGYYSSRITAKRRVRPSDNDRRVAQVWHEYTVNGVGHYQRLRENVNLFNAPLLDYGTGLPHKLTDLIKAFINWAGYPDDEINIPDLPVRVWASVGGPMDNLDPLTDLGELTFGMLDKYLGHFLTRRHNAGDYGQWTLVEPPAAPYTNKAAFVTDPSYATPAIPFKTLPHQYLTYRQTTIPTAFIKKDSMTSWVKPPEGNLIIVSAASKTTLPDAGLSHLFQVFPNFKSYDFGNGLVDTSSPDYLGRLVPLYVMVPELAGIAPDIDGDGNQTLPALNWIGRRIYDVAAHAIKFVSFEAPLVLIDEENPGRGEKRQLGYYDPVLVNGDQFLVRNCNPTYRKDHIQMAVYELEAPRV